MLTSRFPTESILHVQKHVIGHVKVSSNKSNFKSMGCVDIFQHISLISNFMKLYTACLELLHVDRWTDKHPVSQPERHVKTNVYFQTLS
jgi:hypothetical protein